MSAGWCPSRGFHVLVPFYARFPYEVHVVRRACGQPAGHDADEQWGLAGAIHDVIARYDALYDSVMPYMMVLHQDPTTGQYPYHHSTLSLPLAAERRELKYRAAVRREGHLQTDALPGLAEDLRRALPTV